MDNIINKCKETMGEKQFKNVYQEMKEKKQKNIPDKDIYSDMIGKYGKNYKKYLEDVEQLIYLENIAALSLK